MEDLDAIPPPPYSETDIYSVSGASPHINLTPATSQAADTASVGARTLLSTASTTSADEVIYTPPYSPTGSIHQNQVPGEGEHMTSSSSTIYFDSRPVKHYHSGPLELYHITVTPSTEPKDLPYPPFFGARDITEQDWASFINHLLPNHASGVNNEVADRKLRAELLVDERVQSLSLNSDDRASQVDAQLDSIRQPQLPPSPQSSAHTQLTLAEWNEGFFKPRGIKVENKGNVREVLEVATPGPEENAARMPGAWIPYDHELQPELPRNNTGGRRGILDGFMQAGSSGFRMGPIVADTAGFRIGRALRADNRQANFLSSSNL